MSRVNFASNLTIDRRSGMTTPAQYQHQLSQLRLEDIRVDGVTPAEARESLNQLLDLEKHAQEIERAVNLDIQVLRSHYQGRQASAVAGNSSRVIVSNKRRVGGSMRAEEIERLTAEWDSKLNPLEEIKKEIQELLAKSEVSRQKLEKQIKASG